MENASIEDTRQLWSQDDLRSIKDVIQDSKEKEAFCMNTTKFQVETRAHCYEELSTKPVQWYYRKFIALASLSGAAWDWKYCNDTHNRAYRGRFCQDFWKFTENARHRFTARNR